MIIFPAGEVNMCKTALAILASLALTATLEVGYAVYLKNTVTPILFPRGILVPIAMISSSIALFLKLDLIFMAAFVVLLIKNGMTSSPFLGLISIIGLS